MEDNRELSDQDRAMVLDLFNHPGWRVYQQELQALLQRDSSRLGTEDSQRDLRRLQGRTAALKEVLGLPEKVRNGNAVRARTSNVPRPYAVGGRGW